MRSGWRSRGYLPHIDSEEASQFLTWRLADSLPNSALKEWEKELSDLPEVERKKQTLERIGKFLGGGYGSCLLRRPDIGKIVQNALLVRHRELFELHAWVVMPNHVHVLLTPLKGHSLGKIVQLQKGSTARLINEALGTWGTLWQADYFDKFVKDEETMEKVRHYIEWNPVKAGLCEDPTHWSFSSANAAVRSRLLLLD